MAANTITSLNAQKWKPLVQDFLNNLLVSRDICNTKIEELLTDGSSVTFPYMADLYVQNYVQGTDLTVPALNATSSTLTVNASKAVVMAIDPVQEKQATSKYVATMAMQSAFRLANQVDQDVLGVGCAKAASTSSAGTLTTPTIFQLMTDTYATLFQKNATDRDVFCVMDAPRVSLLAQSWVANGFQQADQTLQQGIINTNGFQGTRAGYRVYVSNNLPSSQTLTVAANPTATDTFTLYGVTWTFVANGTAATAGDISLGGSAAATQAIIKDAINGTGTPGASTYIELSQTNRLTYQNNAVSAATFAANASVVTAVGKMGGKSSFTSGSNSWGTETTKMLFGSVGAISLAMQMLPELYIREEPKQIARNYITHTLYGDDVFYRDTFRLVAVTLNA